MELERLSVSGEEVGGSIKAGSCQYGWNKKSERIPSYFIKVV